jgi:hypothetical protein
LDFDNYKDWLIWLFKDVKEQLAALGVEFEDDKLRAKLDDNIEITVGSDEDAAGDNVKGIFVSVFRKKKKEHKDVPNNNEKPYLPDPIMGDE